MKTVWKTSWFSGSQSRYPKWQCRKLDQNKRHRTISDHNKLQLVIRAKGDLHLNHLWFDYINKKGTTIKSLFSTSEWKVFLINTELHAISERNSSQHLVSNSQHQPLQQLFANFSSFARHSFSGHLLGTDPMRPISGPWNQFGAITPHPLGTTADYPLLRGQGSKTHTSKGVPVSSLRHHRRGGEIVFKNEWKWLNMTQWNSNVTESKWNDSRKYISH